MKTTNNSNGSIFQIIKETFRLFYPKHKNKFHFILAVIFISGLIDVATFTSIIPVIYLINNPLPIHENVFLQLLYTKLGFSSNYHFIFFLLICLSVIFLIKNCILLFSSYIQNKFSFLVSFDLIERQMNRFYKLENLDNKEISSVEYIRYLVAAPQEFTDNLLKPLILIIYEVFIVTLVVIIILAFYPVVLLLVIITIVPLSYLLITIIKRRLSVLSDARGKLELESFRLTFENVKAFSDIKLFSKEQVFINSLKKQFNRLYATNVEINVYHGIPRRIVEVLVILAICILYAVTSIWFGASENALMIILLTFATAAYRLMPSVNEILANMIRIKSFKYLLDQLAYINEDVQGDLKEPLSFNKTIEWKNINFSYPDTDRIVLKEVEFLINKGDFVVITGESGSGKSTLGKILIGFIKQSAGNYFIDGTEVLHFNQIKHLYGYVTQDFYLLDKTLIENIAIGEEKVNTDMNRIAKVINICNLNELVSSLSEDGLNYKIGEMGTRLSGGQKQRIAIARALYKQAQILVLDEITSALDVENEIEILNAIYDISKNENLSVVLITHRVSSLKKYDKLYDLQDTKLTRKK